MLDFANEASAIRASFEPYYEGEEAQARMYAVLERVRVHIEEHAVAEEKDAEGRDRISFPSGRTSLQGRRDQGCICAEFQRFYASHDP